MSWTLADIRQFLRDNDQSSASARSQRQYDRIANDAALELRRIGNWDFDRLLSRITYEPYEQAGTVSATVGSTTVTGSGTAFVAGHAGWYVRLNGERQQYLVTAVDAGLQTLTLETAYAGTANLAAVTFVLSQDRAALPDKASRRLQAYDAPLECSQGLNVGPVTLDTLHWWRVNGMEYSTPPRCCSVEFYTASTGGAAPAPYLWIYPSPSERVSLDFWAYYWPLEMTDAAHGISAPPQADPVHRALCLAFLYQAQGEMQKHVAQLQLARGMAGEALGAFRVRRASRQRELWTVEGPRQRARCIAAPGEPVYV